MQTPLWKLSRLALPCVLALAVSSAAARAGDGEAPGFVRLDRIGDSFDNGLDSLLESSLPLAQRADSFAAFDECLPPVMPASASADVTDFGAPAPLTGYGQAGCGCAGCSQPCAKKHGCCLFRCGLFRCCLSKKDDCDECDRGCKPKRKCGCCLWPWGRKDECRHDGYAECGRGHRCGGLLGCCRLLGGHGGHCGHGGHGWWDTYGHQYGSPAEARLACMRCKFGYFIPTGDCGQGLPWAGHYKLVYPLNPDFADPRDGRAFSAQGYGVPVAVPLAPNVEWTYNYGWGVPSSRLTPVSRHVPGTSPILWPVPPGQRY